jgi:hypothetical protein
MLSKLFLSKKSEAARYLGGHKFLYAIPICNAREKIRTPPDAVVEKAVLWIVLLSKVFYRIRPKDIAH